MGWTQLPRPRGWGGGGPGPGEGQRALAASAVTLQAGAPQEGLLLPGSAPEAAWPSQRGTCRSPWEAVQKENFLSELKKPRKDSGEELLRKTAHRCGDPAWLRPPGVGVAGGWGC